MGKRWRGSGDSITRLQWGDKTKRVEARLTEFEHGVLLDTMKALEWKERAVSGFIRALILAEADRVKAGTAQVQKEEEAEDAAWDAAHPEPLKAAPMAGFNQPAAQQAPQTVAARPLQLAPQVPPRPFVPDLSHLSLTSLQLPPQPPPPPEDALDEPLASEPQLKRLSAFDALRPVACISRRSPEELELERVNDERAQLERDQENVKFAVELAAIEAVRAGVEPS